MQTLKKSATRLLVESRNSGGDPLGQVLSYFKEVDVRLLRGRVSAQDTTLMIEVSGPRGRLRAAVKTCLSNGINAQPLVGAL